MFVLIYTCVEIKQIKKCKNKLFCITCSESGRFILPIYNFTCLQILSFYAQLSVDSKQPTIFSIYVYFDNKKLQSSVK